MYLAAIVALFSAFTLQPATLSAQDSPDVPHPPEITARAAFARDISAGVDLYDKNADEQLAAGSTIKIATAIVVRENTALDDQVQTIDTDLVDTELYSNMNLVAGDTLTVEQLLQGLLIPSGGDAARALARYVGAKLLGEDPTSVDPAAATERFVEEMNALVDRLGLQNTHFLTPDGVDTDGQYTSARDLAAIGAELLKDDELRKIVGMPEYNFVSPGGNSYTKTNTNKMLQDDDVIGIKTGSEEQAGACLVLGVTIGSDEVISVVLGSDLESDATTNQTTVDARYDDTRAILDGLRDDYVWVDPSAPSAIDGLADALYAWQVIMKPGPAIVVPAATDQPITFRLRLGPPAPPDQEVGRVLFFAGSEQVGEFPVYQAGTAAGEEATAPAAA